MVTVEETCKVILLYPLSLSISPLSMSPLFLPAPLTPKHMLFELHNEVKSSVAKPA